MVVILLLGCQFSTEYHRTGHPNTYMYSNTVCSFTSFNQTQQWWVRESKQEYLFPLTWDNQGLQEYLQKQNLLPEVNCPYLQSVHVLSSVRGTCANHQFD